MLNFHDVYDFLMILRKVYKKREKKWAIYVTRLIRCSMAISCSINRNLIGYRKSNLAILAISIRSHISIRYRIMILSSSCFASELQLSWCVRNRWCSTLSNWLGIITWSIRIPGIDIFITRSKSILIVLKIFCWDFDNSCSWYILLWHFTFKINSFKTTAIFEAIKIQWSNRRRDGNRS